MDKKNTMLLTVIAVATLLVAVVGATFAYFSVSSSTAGQTTANAEVADIGSVALTGGAAISKTLTAAEMANLGQAKTYDLVTTGGEKTAVIAAANLTTTEEDATYFCSFNLTVVNNSEAEGWTAADGGLTITVAEGVTISDGFTKGTVVPEDVAAGTYKVQFSMGKNATFASKGNLITLSGNVINTAEGGQEQRIAGDTVDVSYTIADFVCDTDDYVS